MKAFPIILNALIAGSTTWAIPAMGADTRPADLPSSSADMATDIVQISYPLEAILYVMLDGPEAPFPKIVRGRRDIQHIESESPGFVVTLRQNFNRDVTEVITNAYPDYVRRSSLWLTQNLSPSEMADVHAYLSSAAYRRSFSPPWTRTRSRSSESEESPPISLADVPPEDMEVLRAFARTPGSYKFRAYREQSEPLARRWMAELQPQVAARGTRSLAAAILEHASRVPAGQK